MPDRAAPTPRRETPNALDPPMVPFAVAGIAIWAAAGLVLWAVGRTDWAVVCLAGFLWGFPGLLVMLRHDANRQRRRDQERTDSTSLSS